MSNEEHIYSVLTASAPFVCIAVVGGIIRQVFRRKVGLKALLCGAAVSGFAGFVTYGTLTYFDLPTGVVGAASGFAGWVGGDGLMFVQDTLAHVARARAGAGHDDMPWDGAERRRGHRPYDGPDRRE